MKNFSIGESYSQAWHLLSSNIALIALFFICSIPELLSNGLSPNVFGAGGVSAIDPDIIVDAIVDSFLGIGLLMFVLQIVLQFGFYNASLNVAKGGKAEFSAYKASAATYVKWVLADLISSIIIGIGFCFCVIPGIFLAIKLMFVPFVILDDPECGFMEAFQRSWDMTKGNLWSLFGFGLATLGVILVGFVCCCIGLYFAIPLAILAEAVVYQTIKPEEAISVEE